MRLVPTGSVWPFSLGRPLRNPEVSGEPLERWKRVSSTARRPGRVCIMRCRTNTLQRMAWNGSRK
jgi:hypothetical protein